MQDEVTNIVVEIVVAFFAVVLLGSLIAIVLVAIGFDE